MRIYHFVDDLAAVPYVGRRAARAYGCGWSYARSLYDILTNGAWKFHQIYHFSAVGDEDELIKFW